MVKRAKSPDIPETDKYYTVYKPYPSNADFEVQEDYITCARWIATVIGPDPLHGMWWKPSARGMIILEVDKQYPHNERILGEHRWDDFLKKSTPDEKGRVSQIFHSFYAKGRDAQKDGWKRIHVESAWFQNWNPNLVMRLPYPETHWCPVPKEDTTNKSLCRPLPVKDKAPPQKAAPPVVGSSAWAQARSKAPPTQRALQNAWAQKKVEAQAQAAGAGPENRTAWNKPIASNVTASSGPPANAWSKPPLMTPAINSARGGLNAKPHGSWGEDYPAPPGLVKSTTNNSASTANTSSGSGSGSGTMTDWTSMDDELPDISQLAGRVKTITISQSQQAILDGNDPYDSDPLIPDEHEILNPWEMEGDDDVPIAGGVYIASGSALPGEPAAGVIEEEVYDEKYLPNAAWTEVSGGNGYQGAWADPVEKPQEKIPASLLPCPHHPGRNCKKGICQWRAEVEKKEAKEKKEAEKKEQQRLKREQQAREKAEGRIVPPSETAESEDGNWRRDDATSVTSGTDDGFAPASRGRGRGGRRGKGRGRA